VTVKGQKTDTVASPSAPKVTFQSCLDKQLKPDFYKGKFLVLDFWETWCAPCIAGFPHFNEFADKYNNPDVLFAAMTDEPASTARKFFERTKKQLHALKLSDTTRLTHDAFKINSYPTCVIIGPDNTLMWQGETGQLTADILDKVIVQHQNLYKPSRPSPLNALMSANVKKKPLRSLLRFSITEADTGKNVTPHFGGSGSIADGTVISYGMQDVQLGDFIQDITGFSSTSRILTNDTGRLSKAYNIDYNIGSDTSRYKLYSNAILKSSPFINFTLSTAGDVLKFKAAIESKKVRHYQLVITDTAKLHSFKSMSSHKSFSADHPPKIEYVGYTLKQEFDYYQYATKTIITMDDITDSNHYDLSVDAADMDAFKKSLQFYGLALKEVNSDVEFLSINFY